ncbi:hypothetical protein BJ742DRAFT_887440 [Cladochytrium replicatum]|nr:hypothetical protein BJ742DRAFT_887440 [Cladochytrium replicatum]
MPYQKCPNAFILEPKVRFMLDNEKLLFRRHQPSGADAANVKSHNNDIEIGVSSSPINDCCVEPLLYEINGIYMHGVRKFSHSCFMNLYMGQFHLIWMGNRASCLASHARGTTLSPKLDEAFLIFRRERLLNERFAGGDVIALSVGLLLNRTSSQRKRTKRKNEKKALINMVQFWAEQLMRSPNYRKLHESAPQIVLLLGWHELSQSVNTIVPIHSLLPTANAEEFIITNENLKILHQTQGCPEILKLPSAVEGMADVKQVDVILSNCIPQFEHFRDQLMSKEGGRWVIQKEGQPFDVCFAAEELIVAGKLNYLCGLRLPSLLKPPYQEEIAKVSPE